MDLDLSKFHLDFERGKIYRIFKDRCKSVGYKRKDGYIIIGINGKIYYNHRILYERFHNVKLEKEEVIDHINQIKNDNRICNLRVVSNKLNAQNRGKQNNNTSGYKNISFRKDRNKYEVHIKEDGKNTFYGYFENLEDAVKKRDTILKDLNDNNNCIFTV